MLKRGAMPMRRLRNLLALLCLMILTVSLLAGCGQSQQASQESQGEAGEDGKVRIGLSLATLAEERWQRDRDFFVKKAEELGAEVLVQAANGDENLQNSQAENLLTQGVDVLVVVPQNGKTAAAIVEAAKKANVPVIAYDRLILDSDLDLYISFDSVAVGEAMAKYAVSKVPRGNYVIINGSPTDDNAHLVNKGFYNILKPYIDKGDIKVAFEQWADSWSPEKALEHMENALTTLNNDVDVVLAANDGTASGAIQALAEQNLAGKVLVTGQDAELAALQRIVKGTQTMTVYKPLQKLAERAAEIAVDMARGKKPETTTTINNGKVDVPSVLLEVIPVDKGNIKDTVVADGFHKLEDICKPFGGGDCLSQ